MNPTVINIIELRPRIGVSATEKFLLGLPGILLL